LNDLIARFRSLSGFFDRLLFRGQVPLMRDGGMFSSSQRPVAFASNP
jgi:hypothetical protein